MSTGFERYARRICVVGWRTRNINEVGRLAIKHQGKVVIDSSVLREVDRKMAPRRYRVVNCSQADAIAGTPCRQMSLGGDFAEARDCAAQHPQAVFRSESRRAR